MSQSMAKLESGSGSDGINKASQNNVMFVDTSLDTHLALLVSDSDTVSDLKKKILYEHPLCFPSIGKIQIHALKVKRKGNFYHLSDTMFVKSAFDGVKNSWFLCVDASCSVEQGENQNSCIPASNNMLACFGIKNSTSFDRVNLPHEGPLKRASNFDDLSLPPVGGNQNVKEKVPISDKYGSSDSGKEVLEVKDGPIHGSSKDASQQDIIVPENSLINTGKEVPFDTGMGNKDIADEPCRSSSSNTSKRSVSEIKRTNNLSKETEVTEKLDNCVLDKFKNDVDVQCNNSLEETSKSRSYAKRKRNIEKKNGYWDSLKEMRPVTCNSNKAISKAENASQHSAGDKQKTNAILDSISTEPVEDSHLLETISSSGKSKKRRKKSSNPLIQLASAVPASGKDVGEENSRVTVGINHKDSSGERTAASVPRQDVQGATTSELRGLSVEEKQSDPVHEVGGNDKLTSSLVHKQKTNTTLDSLASETLKNVLPATDSSNGKKKRKKKSSNPLNRAVTSVPSFEKDVEEESSRVTGGINRKDSSKEPHAASVPGKGVHGVMTPELCGIYQKQKQCDSFHEVRENDKVSSSLGDSHLDICETEAGSVKSKNIGSKEAVVGVERNRNSKDSHFADLKFHQAVGVEELSNLEINIELSRPENGVLNDDDNFETDQTDRVEEEGESLHDRDPKGVLSEKFKPPVQVETDMNAKEVIATSEFLDGTGLVEHRKSGKKERKKRRAEDSVGGTPIKSGIELVKSSEHDISSAEPHKTVNGDHSSNKAKKEENTFSQTKGNDDDNFETDQTDRVEEEGESLHDRDPKGVLLEKFKPPIRVETDMNAKEVIATSKFLDGTGLVEHRKSGKKERKKRRAEDSVGGTPVKSGIELVKSSEHDISSAEPHKTVNGDQSSNKAKKEENTFSQTKGNDDDNFETDQTDRVEEEGESLHDRDPKGVLLEKFKPPVRVETDMNAKEVIATSKFLDGTGLVEHRKSGKKERKKRRAEDSVGGTPIKSGIELVKSSEHDISLAEPHKNVNGDHSNNQAKKEENTFFQAKGKEISKTKTVSTSLLATVRETGDVNGDEMESLEQISKTQANAEIIDEKMRKKSKKKQNSTAQNLLDLQRKDQDVGHKDSADTRREVEASSKLTNEKQGGGEKLQVGSYSTIKLQGDECAEHMLRPKKKLVKVSGSEDLVGGTPIKSGIEPGKSSEHEIFSAEPLKTVNSDHSSEISKKEESKFSQTEGKEVSKTNTVSTSLLATGREAGDVHGDEVQSLQKISKTQINAENMDEKMRKKSKKKQNSTAKNLLDLLTKAQDGGPKDPTPSADNQREVASCKMTNEKQGSGGKSQAGNSSTIQLQESLSKDECAEDMLHPEKKLLKVSRSGMKTPRSTKSDKFTSIPEDVRRPSVVKDSDTSINSERKSEAFAVSKSNLGNSKNIVHESKLGNEIQSGLAWGVGKAFVNDIGEVVNNSEQDKSLLAKLGAIFKDDSSGSSEDEDGMVNSDASATTPSDNSFSSDYSDGESNANLNSPRNGSYDSKRKKGDRRSITKAFSSGEKSLTLDTVLRSSSRYKKAKLTASQSQQEDTESQPVDFVPDSQADL